MRMLSLYILTAGAALTATGALAADGPGGPPPGATWHGPPPMAGMPMHGPNGPNVMIRQGGGPGPMRMMHGGPGPMGHGGMRFPHRVQRGFVIPPFFFGQQFYLNDWQSYGFSDPGPDQRWIRYYDDAYLIDRGGRVVDTREDMDWQRYGDDWDDDDGIPARRERHARHDRDDDRGDGHGDGRWEERGGGGYAYGGGYGYGYYAYPIVIETVTTSGGTSYVEEVTEEYVSVRRPHRVHRRARCSCAAPAPRPAPRPAPPRRPPPGERG
jgi:hypothetical protein